MGPFWEIAKPRKIKNKNDPIKNKLPSVPSTLGDEIRLNIFLKFDDLNFKKRIGLGDLNEVDFFKKIRDLKDNF